MFCRLKDFRRVATRYDRSATNFLAAVSTNAPKICTGNQCLCSVNAFGADPDFGIPKLCFVKAF
jgi:hypothetical protein